MAIIIDGKATSAALRVALKEQVSAFVEKHSKKPGLAVVLVGEDPASAVYVRNKHRACEEVGMHSAVYRLPENTSDVFKTFGHRSIIFNSAPYYMADKQSELDRSKITMQHFIFTVENKAEIESVISSYKKHQKPNDNLKIKRIK